MFTIHPATRSLFSLTRLSLLTALLAALTFSPHASAQPTGPQPWWPVQPRALPFLHPLFTSDMVMQRDLAAPIWGWAKPGDKITVQVDGKAAAEAVAGADGRWAAKVGPFAAGGPHTVVVEGGGRKESLTNVLFGDVWLCTGQSNMNWPVRLSQNAEEEVKAATNANIRSFTVNFYSSFAPEQLPPAARWEPCTPEFAKNFTAVGYFLPARFRPRWACPSASFTARRARRRRRRG